MVDETTYSENEVAADCELDFGSEAAGHGNNGNATYLRRCHYSGWRRCRP